MAGYYFLVAQLPHLSYNQAAPMSSEAFLTLCAENLSTVDAALLQYCRLGIENTDELPPTTSEFIDAWRRRERALALNLATLRASKLKRDITFEPDNDPPEAAVLAKTAFAMENPYEAEMYIDKCRWDAINELTVNCIFGVNMVYAYLLKLRLLERRALLKTEDGFTEYQALYAKILENAPKAGEN